eukprot:scaffold59887_cov42-Phaeocystis_antarctica.AAC.3
MMLASSARRPSTTSTSAAGHALHETGQKARIPSSSHPGSQLISTWSVQVHFFDPPPTAAPLQAEPAQTVGGVRARDAGAAAAVIVPRRLARARAGQVAAPDVGRKVLVGHQPPRGREGKAAVGHLEVGAAHGLPVALLACRYPLVPHPLQAVKELVAHSLVRRNDAVAAARAAAPAAAAVLRVVGSLYS